MSLILDALRRKSADAEEQDASGRPVRTDSVLATLGFARPTPLSRVSLKTMLMYGGAAVAVGFVGASLGILMLAPSATKKPPAPPVRTVARGPETPVSPPVSSPPVSKPPLQSQPQAQPPPAVPATSAPAASSPSIPARPS